MGVGGVEGAVLLWNFSARMLPKVYIPNPALD